MQQTTDLYLRRLCRRLTANGVAQVGYSHLAAVLPPRYAGLPWGISLVFRLSTAVVDEILTVKDTPSPTFSYFQHYRAVNAFLDQQTLWLCTMLERRGYRALPVPASQSVKDMGPYSGIFPHKTAAVLAGLGWIGKSALFVSPEFGPRVRLATVLTDMPLPVAHNRVPNGCHGCRACADACPAGAISGQDYQPGAPRSTLLDPQACSEHMKRAYRDIGRGAVCGICMAVCPYGKQRPALQDKPVATGRTQTE